MSGPGRILSEHNQAGIWGRLANFDIARTQLKTEHLDFLRTQVAPILSAGGSLRLIGLASRTGSPAFNQRLSEQRRDAVSAFLRGISGATFQIARNDAQGEQAAAYAGVPDNQEHENWRSVIFSAWNRPIPPPPPPPLPPPPSAPPRMIQRFIRREWIASVRPVIVGDEHDQDAERFSQWGENAMRRLHPETCEQTPIRRNTSENHLINVIRYRRWGERAGSGLAQVDMVAVTYEWGIPQQFVQFFRTTGRPEMITREQARVWIDNPGSWIFNHEF